mgnify:CR=1 FL=1
MTLSNAAEIVFLAATVPVLLRVNHDRNGRTADGRTATMAIGGKQPWVAFPLKRLRRSRVKLHGACIGLILMPMRRWQLVTQLHCPRAYTILSM